MNLEEKDGWGSWSKYIIKELERLALEISKVQDTITKKEKDSGEKLKEIEKEINTFKTFLENAFKEIKKNEDSVDSIIDNDLKEILSKIDKLERFNIKLMTIASIIGILFSVSLTILGWFKWKWGG